MLIQFFIDPFTSLVSFTLCDMRISSSKLMQTRRINTFSFDDNLLFAFMSLTNKEGTRPRSFALRVFVSLDGFRKKFAQCLNLAEVEIYYSLASVIAKEEVAFFLESI